MELRRSRAATIPLVAGRPSLDLANTVSRRSVTERRQDHLLDTDDALTWCVRVRILDQPEANTLARDLAGHPHRAHTLVQELAEVRQFIWTHIVDSDAVETEALSPLVVNTLAHCTLQATDHGTRWVVTTLDEHTPARRAVVDLLDLLTHPTGRIGHCSDPTCRWAFIDTSRAKNRRWCSSADCGNRHRVRQHHARQQHPPQT